MMSADLSKLLIVNYHYVRDPGAYRYPGIHPLSPDAFERQVKDLRAKFHVADPTEVEDFFLNHRSYARPSVFITFDDGLIDHWQTAHNILDPLGIKAAFFVCSRPAIEGRALAVHKIHWLRAHTEPTAFTEELFSYLPGDRRQTDDASWAPAAERMYIYDSPQIAKLKFALNFILPSDLIDDVTSTMLVARGMTEAEFCHQTYMSDGQLRALTENGHKVGLHGHSHAPFRRLGGDLFAEVRQNQEYVALACGGQPSWVSYPNGRDDAVPDAAVLDELFDCLDLRLGFTMFGTWNDGSESAGLVRRINTNEVAAVVADVVPA